jgi:glycosyltransferase involved in cell wall biosynthesis
VRDLVGHEAARLAIVALVHHPLAEETGLTPAAAAALRASETRALQSARLVIVTSPATARLLPAYGVPAERIVVVEPGTEPAPPARGSSGPDVALLCVATLIPRKGHDVLIRALGQVQALPWRLTCVGSTDIHPATTDTVRRMIAEAGLHDRVTLTGSRDRDELSALYDTADVVVMPTYYEGYGMAVAEALARGLPVVATPTGGIPDLVGPDAGILVPAGDDVALAAALRSVIEDATLRARLAEGARRARLRLPTWHAAAETFARALP